MKSLFPIFDKVEHLRRADGRMAQVVEQFGQLEMPSPRPLFEVLVENIISQQIATPTARGIILSLGSLLGSEGITPEAIMAVGTEGLRSCGIPQRKAGWIVSAAERFATGEFAPEKIEKLSDKRLIQRLTSLDGVGVWTAEMLLLFALGRENILSWNDLIVRRAIATLYGEKNLSQRRFDHYRRRFAPYGSVASLYLWAYGNRLPREQKITIKPLDFGRLRDKHIDYSFHPTPYGRIMVASTAKGICRVAFADDRQEATDELRAEMRGCILTERTTPAHRLALRAIAGKAREELVLYLQGTPFERKVWREVLKVPYGITLSYADIAAATGFTKAYRSVGNAVSANPVAIIIPCHRIIHADGTLGDYNAGPERKEQLLEREQND